MPTIVSTYKKPPPLVLPKPTWYKHRREPATADGTPETSSSRDMAYWPQSRIDALRVKMANDFVDTSLSADLRAKLAVYRNHEAIDDAFATLVDEQFVDRTADAFCAAIRPKMKPETAEEGIAEVMAALRNDYTPNHRATRAMREHFFVLDVWLRKAFPRWEERKVVSHAAAVCMWAQFQRLTHDSLVEVDPINVQGIDARAVDKAVTQAATGIDARQALLDALEQTLGTTLGAYTLGVLSIRFQIGGPG